MEVHHHTHHPKKWDEYNIKFVVLFAFLLLSMYSNAQSPEQNLKSLGITLPKQSAPIANYVNYVRTGNLIYFSGSGPSVEDQGYVKGKLGKDLTIDQGKEAARITGINMIANLKNAIGDLNKVKRIVKVLGMVNSTEDFTDQPKVINGFSDLMVAVFGEKGKHARSAVGMNALPLNMAVEIEMIVEVEDKLSKNPVYEVAASCGTCMFKMDGKGCQLAIRFKGKNYFVDGTSIDDHGDAHAKEGFCNAIKKAKVQGTVVGDRFLVSYFELIK